MWILNLVEINAARLLVMDCAKQIDEIDPMEHENRFVIKFYVAEVFRKVLIVHSNTRCWNNR